jgi:hypothetical protein
MKLRIPLLSLVAALAGSTPAAAGSLLTTPPVHANNDDVICVVQYVGEEDTAATATLRNLTGVAVDGGSPYPIYTGVNTPAGQANATGYFYCVFEGLTKEMRGYIALEVGDQSTVVLPATR